MRISRGVIHFRTIPVSGIEVIEIVIGNVNRSLAVTHAFDSHGRKFDHIAVVKMLRELACALEREV